jgi:hypothetical protein
MPDVTPRVLLDTNVLVANFQSGNAYKLLIEGARTRQLQLVVPELVLREAANKFREMAAERAREYDKAVSGLARLGMQVKAKPDPDPAAAAVRYDANLRRTLRDINATIAALPDVTHDALLTKTLARRKPFRDGDAGYRDALLWETAMEQAKEHGELILCTMNTRDFAEAGEGDIGLGPDLAAELQAAGLPPTAISLEVNLKALVERLVSVEAVAVNEVERALPLHYVDLSEQIEAQIYHYDFDRSDLREVSMELGTYWLDLEVESISVNDAQVLRVFEISHASVEEAHTYSEQELLVSLHVECDADVDLDLELEGVDRETGMRRTHWQTFSTTKTLALSIEATFHRSPPDFLDFTVFAVRFV